MIIYQVRILECVSNEVIEESNWYLDRDKVDLEAIRLNDFYKNDIDCYSTMYTANVIE